jgi:hypothetical protein
MYLHKIISKKNKIRHIFFVGVLNVIAEKSRILTRIRITLVRDTDPENNVTDPERFKQSQI